MKPRVTFDTEMVRAAIAGDLEATRRMLAACDGEEARRVRLEQDIAEGAYVDRVEP